MWTGLNARQVQPSPDRSRRLQLAIGRRPIDAITVDDGLSASVADEHDRAAAIDVEIAGRIGVLAAAGAAQREMVGKPLEGDDVGTAAGRTPAERRVRVGGLHGFAQ